MSCDVCKATEGLEKLILQVFRLFTYVTGQSPTLLSLLLRHRLFTYVTCEPPMEIWIVWNKDEDKISGQSTVEQATTEMKEGVAPMPSAP